MPKCCDLCVTFFESNMFMPPLKLNNATVKALEPNPDRQVEYRDEGQKGLSLIVSPNGTKAWSMRYRTREGKVQRRLKLGNFPDMKTQTARNTAEQKLGVVATGGDPALDEKRKKAKANADNIETIGQLIEAYFEAAARGRHKPGDKVRAKRVSTLKSEWGYAERLVIPKFGKLPIAGLDRSTLQAFLNKVGDGAPSTARQCRNVVRQAYSYAIWQQLAEVNPATLTAIEGSEPRKRTLKDHEITAIWRACSAPGKAEGAHVSFGVGHALMLTLTTAQRAGEVSGIHSRELDLASRIWTLPGERSKNRREHVIPLSELALSIIGQAQSFNGSNSGYLFPSPKGNGPVTRAALSRACKRVTTALDIENATPHDFRRTAATRMTSEKGGVRRFIVSRVLNHSSAGEGAAVTGTYDQNEYLSDKREALDKWAVLLSEIVSEG